jgi:hypothetical protein
MDAWDVDLKHPYVSASQMDRELGLPSMGTLLPGHQIGLTCHSISDITFFDLRENLLDMRLI